MASTASKWLLGCGIGCGALILIGVLIVGVGYLFVKDTVQDFRETEISTRRITETYGEIEDYCPKADGRIPSDRIEIFLMVRDSTAAIRQEMVQSLATITDDIRGVENQDDKPFFKVLGIIKKGFSALPQLAGYYTKRNYQLLDAGMGLGEYMYIYTTAYYAYLAKPLSDGPDFPLMNTGNSGIRYETEWEEEDNDEVFYDDVKENRHYQILKRVRRMVIPMMVCQLDELEATSSLTKYSSAWKTALKEEIADLKHDRMRLPWENGVPKVIAESLEPYQVQLEASYEPLLNPIEVMTEN